VNSATMTFRSISMNARSACSWPATVAGITVSEGRS
jgi:hypothetical protein